VNCVKGGEGQRYQDFFLHSQNWFVLGTERNGLSVLELKVPLCEFELS